jgi:hypothetical protein
MKRSLFYKAGIKTISQKEAISFHEAGAGALTHRLKRDSRSKAKDFSNYPRELKNLRQKI